MNQKWEIKYLKETSGIKIRKSEKFVFNKSFGLYVNRPFRILTNMKSRRVLTSIKNNVVLANTDAAAAQYWIFDPSTNTIES
jgi:hypothetical protein